MNPRLFCRERTYHKALLLTYSFDPNFFEQVVLSDLWHGRTGDILVMADRQQILESTSGSAGQLWHLGRNYLLAPANHDRAFHPKMILRLGAQGGAVLIGSGNLTSSGWGGNQELGASWQLGPGCADNGAWLHEFLEHAMNWCSSELERDAVVRMRDVLWLARTRDQEPSGAVLYSKRNESLAQSLAQRWAGRRFESVRILTGSTDESGAFLRWAHSTFGIRRADVALTPAMASFDPAQLADLPIDLKLITAPPNRVMHAKFYWFEGESGAAAVMGSANCSAAAWLLSPSHGGNIEVVVAYDSALSEQFQDVLGAFEGPSRTAQEMFPTNAAVPNSAAKAAASYRLLGLSWDKNASLLAALIDPCPNRDAKVELIVDSRTILSAVPSNSESLWTAELPEESTGRTRFGYARISQGAGSWKTSPRWIDDLVLLRHASQSVRLLEPFNGLERGITSAQHRQTLQDLQEVAQVLLNDASALQDPRRATTNEASGDCDALTRPVNPADLVCHLDEGPQKAGNPSSSIQAGMVSISGILRLLFDAEGDGPGTSAADEDERYVEEDLDATGQKGESNHLSTSEHDEAVIEKRFRDRLASQISDFLTRLKSPEFAERCTATQMVQAIAFPLAVSVRARKRGWLAADLAETWALEVVSILFRGGTRDQGGLLHSVERRYKENDQGAIFGEVVGNGVLWTVLVPVLGGTRWKGVGADLEKAIALREVFTSRQLLATASAHQIAGLLGNIRLDNARKYLELVAPSVTKLLDSIEERLRRCWKEEAQSQSARNIPHKAGDLMWRDQVGWAVCLATNEVHQYTRVRLNGQETQISAGFYVNASELAARDRTLLSMLQELRSCIEAPTFGCGQQLAEAERSTEDPMEMLAGN